MNFDEITKEILSLCVDYKTIVSYRDEGEKRIFKFSKNNAQVIKIINVTELEYKDHEILLKEIHRALSKLYKRAMESAQ